MRPIYADGKGAWSPVYRFLSMDPLDAPLLNSPAHKAEVTSPVTLTWQSVVNGSNYLVVVAKDAAFTQKVDKVTTPDLTAPFLLLEGKYYWRVRAIDASGGKGPWSEVRIVKVIATP